MNYASFDDVKQIVTGMAKKIPHGIMQDETQVGHITWQIYLMRDYLKLDGTPLANASNDYSELLKFAQDNSLITSDTTDKSLFKYDSGTDVLTLPDYIGLCLQGGNTIEEKEAGLPNIKGSITFPAKGVWSASGALRKSSTASGTLFAETSGSGSLDLLFNANNSNSIYKDSVNTVQPPAITLIPQIKYKKSSTVWETIDIGRFVATSPVYYERAELPTPNKTTITIHNTWVNINNAGYVLENDKVLDLTNSDSWDDATYTTASNRAGKDFYIYACEPVSDVAPKFILSANSTIPTGYTADTSRKIGGFHCLCLSVGTISGHTLSGYLTGDILPLSVWDLQHRAVSDNEGMVYIPPIGMWGDIYLGSWNGSNLVSKFNGVCVTGTSAKAMHGLMFAEEFGLVNKHLPTYDEFIVSAKGTPEGSHISTDALPAGAGGHVDKSSRRIISNYGLEDCVGVLWQWSKDHCETMLNSGGNATTYKGAYWDGTSAYLNGYSWQDIPVYNSTVDSVKRGSCDGLLRRLIFGGNYGRAVADCGSRVVDAVHFGAQLFASVSGRGFSKVR